MLLNNHRTFISKDLKEYINNTTQNSIKKIIEKRKEPIIINHLEEIDINEKPNRNFFGILIFLSISSMAFYFYKKLY
jgi:hypothetical protein